MTQETMKATLENSIKFIEKKRALEKKRTDRDLIKQVNKKTIEYLKHIRAIQEGRNLARKKSPEKGESSTLIIAAKCKDGVVMVADRRMMRGTECGDEKKINEFYKVSIAFAGLTGLRDKFLETVEGVLQAARAVNLSEAIIGVEDTMALISDRYQKRLGAATQINALLAGLKRLSSGGAKLYHIMGNGYAEEIDFLCIGHGAPYATSIAQGLYHTSLTMEAMAEIAIFIINWVEKVDSSVGGIPDVVFVKNEKGIIDMDKAKVEEIYKKAGEVTKKLPKFLPQAIQSPIILEAQKSSGDTSDKKKENKLKK